MGTPTEEERSGPVDICVQRYARIVNPRTRQRSSSQKSNQLLNLPSSQDIDSFRSKKLVPLHCRAPARKPELRHQELSERAILTWNLDNM